MVGTVWLETKWREVGRWFACAAGSLLAGREVTEMKIAGSEVKGNRRKVSP